MACSLSTGTAVSGHTSRSVGRVLKLMSRYSASCALSCAGSHFMFWPTLPCRAATLSGWRDAFLAAGEASLAARPTAGEELESERLKARLGEMLLERELLEAKVAALEGGRPLARRRSRP